MSLSTPLGADGVMLSGRELARQRRQALAQSGKAGLQAARALRAAPRNPSAAARSGTDCGCGCGGSDPAACPARSAPAAQTADEVAQRRASLNALPTGKRLAQARRTALAHMGKAGLQRVAQASRIAATMPERGDWQAALAQGASGRQLAMQHRLVQSLAGRTAAVSSSASRPSGRVRPTAAVSYPEKVELTHTLSGQPVTGNAVDRSAKVTGQEAGSCRNVTGVEYLSDEHFDQFCASRPQPAPSRVLETHTQGQQRVVTGQDPGPSSRVTGNETGVCRGITGTQYLAHEVGQQCQSGALAPSAPHKVSVMSSRREQTVTGTAVSGSQRVTGGEAGALRPITGSQYALSRSQAQGSRPGAFTRSGGYPKFDGDSALRGAAVTATAAQPSVAAAASTPHLAADAAPQRAAAGTAPQPQLREAGWHAQNVTGDRPGVGGGRITGDERGACEPLTGTPCVGPDNQFGSCSVSSQWLTRYPELALEAPAPAPQAFSVSAPQHATQPLRQRVTGTGAGAAQERVTGPGQKAQGLITGTPEFRHPVSVMRPRAAAAAAELAPRLATAAPAEADPDDAIALPPSASRISGEGAQNGTRITGDAWGQAQRVTGTEGASVMSRNPSQRGQARGQGASARQFKDVEREERPVSAVTGSSGNTGRGALVTLSGGARG